MSFWCGVLFAMTTAFSLNVLYHDLFVTESGDVVPKGSLIGSLYQAAGNGAVPNSLEFISSPKLKIHHPFTALLPAKQTFEIQFDVQQEEATEKDGEPPEETGLAVRETGLSVIQIAPFARENEEFDVEIVEIVSDLDEDEQETTILDEDLSGETFQTCPAKAAVSVKTEVEEDIPKPVSEVISLGVHENISTTNETVNLTEEVIQEVESVEKPIPELPQSHLEHDIIVLLAAHLALVVSVLLMGCRCLCAHKYNVNSTVDVEELLVTVGLISCIVVALFALLGATIILFIRILLAKFP